MAKSKSKDKKAQRIIDIFNKANSATRVQWEYINQKGFDFANDNQLTHTELSDLEDQGMPTFTINRIAPVVEMLNYYATANTPRWQAVGAQGDDSAVAGLFSDIAEYIWYNSDGGSVYSNAINDAITKSTGFIQVDVDPDSDRGMGDVVLKQPEPFDIYVDPKSRDILFRDAAFILIRKVLPKSHLKTLYPEHEKLIEKANVDNNTDYVYSEKSVDTYRKDFSAKDIPESESVDPDTGDHDKLCDYLELYEKKKVSFVNVFYSVAPDPEQMKGMKEEIEAKLEQMQKELMVQLKEQETQMSMAVQEGKMLKERFQLEMEKAMELMESQLQGARQEFELNMISEAQKIVNRVVSEKEYKVLMGNSDFAATVTDQVQFYEYRIKVTKVIGDQLVSERVLPENIKDYPIVPFHYKWTGTPFAISAVSPLIGKQREMNKSHQIMVHNASLGSSLRWMHEEGSIDMDYWEKYSSSPGALLPIRPGSQAPTPVMPAPLSNAFFSVVQEGKQDMEYLAGIYGAMQGDTSAQHDTFRGMMAMDEYGTRRVKSWLKNAVEPALRQLGRVVQQFSQAIYTSHKVMNIVMTDEIANQKQIEINIPVYDDAGYLVEKHNDYNSAKFDVRVVAGSTLPVNRWAYLDELKGLYQMGIVDDIAVLGETDIRNKEDIAKRKSIYMDMKSQIEGLSNQLKERDGTIETLSRQLVQAGIKGKVMQAGVEVDKKKNEMKTIIDREANESKTEQAFYKRRIKERAELEGKNLALDIKSFKNNLENGNKN
jgi:hypothetical protein